MGCVSLLAYVAAASAQVGAGVVDFNQQLGSVDPEFQSAVQQRLDQIVAQIDAVGATVAIVVDGKLQAAAASGLRKFGSPEPLLVTDPMHAGSNTKGMTALLFGKMVDQGKLRFEQTLGATFPHAASSDLAKVPLLELLRHRSGLTDKTVPNLFDKKYLPQPPADYYHGGLALYAEERGQYARDCVAGSPGVPPATKFVYDNANYIVVGAAQEIAAGGTFWEDLMQAEIFGPLHMKAAGFGAMGTGKDVAVPWQHKRKAGGWAPLHHDNPRYLGPAGTVHCSALDLANFAHTLAQGASGHSPLLKPKTWTTLLAPPSGSSYACGVIAGAPDANGVRDLSHRGSNAMSASEWWVRDHGRVVLVLMVNCDLAALTAPMRALLNLTEKTFGIES